MKNKQISRLYISLYGSRKACNLLKLFGKQTIFKFLAALSGRKGTSLVAQSLGIHLPVQGTRVWSLVWEDPTCCGATKPMCHNYWAWALEPASHNYWAHVPQLLKPAHSRAWVPQLLSPYATTTEARVPRACAPQQEKPLQWEARAPQRRVAPARRN